MRRLPSSCARANSAAPRGSELVRRCELPCEPPDRKCARFECELLGVKEDMKIFTTKAINDNGFNPSWDETFEFDVCRPDAALLLFTVWDKDLLSKDDFIGQVTVLADAKMLGLLWLVPLTFLPSIFAVLCCRCCISGCGAAQQSSPRIPVNADQKGRRRVRAAGTRSTERIAHTHAPYRLAVCFVAHHFNLLL